MDVYKMDITIKEIDFIMNRKKYSEEIMCPTLNDFANSYPQYAPFAKKEGESLFDLLVSPKVIIKANERKARLVNLFWDFAQDNSEVDAVWVAKRLCDEFTGLSDVIEHTAQTERLALNH